jgi:hypothetical protein
VSDDSVLPVWQLLLLLCLFLGLESSMFQQCWVLGFMALWTGMALEQPARQELTSRSVSAFGQQQLCVK